MKSYKSRNKLRSETPSGVPAGRATKLYPERIQKFITKNHIGVGPKEMAKLLNQTFGTNYTVRQMKSYYANRKINSGLTGCFKKGHIPFNKGKKGLSIGGKTTQFKKGHRPANYLPVGTEAKKGDGYVYIKIADPNKWKQKHILIWEECNGPVPSGHVILFGDSDRYNFDISNLICVSKHQLLILNQKGLIQKDADLTKTGITIAKIHQKISERKKL
ncbi:HNH endonuclease [Clostridium sp. 'deep sea']|nr:HNH endonuclease [Clostridium sp. 'deep sea']